MTVVLHDFFYTLFPLYSHVYSRLSPVLPSSSFVIILPLNSFK